jgi:hypothetical protein
LHLYMIVSKSEHGEASSSAETEMLWQVENSLNKW